MTTEHSYFSSTKEKIIEHLVVGELLKTLWIQGERRIEILTPQVDDGGYDIVITAKNKIRYIQFKSSYSEAKTARQKINLELGNKPGGCVVWIIYNEKTMNIGPYYWFGSDNGGKLPDISGLKVARHSKGNKDGYKAERPNVRIVPKKDFYELPDIGSLLGKLFN